MAGIFLNTDSSGRVRFDQNWIPDCFDAKKRPNKAVLRPYLQISFYTDFEALFNGTIGLSIYSVKN